MSLATIKLHAIEGGLSGQDFVFEGPAHCTIGRAHDCDIRLPMEAGELDVSRHHCVLEIKPPAAKIRDVGSLNGTYVNGVKIGQRMPLQTAEDADLGPVADRVLYDGDEIQIGHNVLRVEVAGVDEPAPAEPAPAVSV